MLSSLSILRARNVEPCRPPVPTGDHVARRQDLCEAAAGGQAGRQHGQPIIGEVEPAQLNQRAEAARQSAQLAARHICTRGSCALYESVLRIRCGSGSGDPCLLLVVQDPAFFVIDLQDANKN
jgi:hypothetical protein